MDHRYACHVPLRLFDYCLLTSLHPSTPRIPATSRTFRKFGDIVWVRVRNKLRIPDRHAQSARVQRDHIRIRTLLVGPPESGQTQLNVRLRPPLRSQPGRRNGVEHRAPTFLRCGELGLSPVVSEEPSPCSRTARQRSHVGAVSFGERWGIVDWMVQRRISDHTPQLEPRH